MAGEGAGRATAPLAVSNSRAEAVRRCLSTGSLVGETPLLVPEVTGGDHSAFASETIRLPAFGRLSVHIVAGE